MIKVRHGSFETNSSSVHTLAWRNILNVDDVSEEAYVGTYTNIVDLSILESYYGTFGEKIVALYLFIDNDEHDLLYSYRDKYYQLYDRTEHPFDIDELYSKDVKIGKLSFREIYKNLKSDLLDVIKEITGEKPEFLNEETFEYDSYDMGGFVPSGKKEITEFLLNKDILFVHDEDSYDIDRATIGHVELSNLIEKREEHFNKTWFEWFKIEKE